ncbi:hypothetical protein D3C75_752270 [compost metagenome]
MIRLEKAQLHSVPFLQNGSMGDALRISAHHFLQRPIPVLLPRQQNAQGLVPLLQVCVNQARILQAAQISNMVMMLMGDDHRGETA